MSGRVDGIVRNRVLEILSRGEVALSMQVRLVDSVEIAQIAGSAGYDSLYVDVEHSAMSLWQASQICVAALGVGIAPFVRVPSPEPEYVSRALDGGAMGVIVPHVANADDARKAVRASKFPPLGDRSVSTGLPQLQFRSWPLAEARRVLNERTAVVAMIESREALENVEEIAAVEGIDILFVGTNDLCAQLGIDGQFEHDEVEAAYVRTIAACHRHGKHAGIGGLAGRPALVSRFVGLGARYVSAGSDLQYLVSAASERSAMLRAAIRP